MIAAWLAGRTRAELTLGAVAAVVIFGALYFVYVIEPLQEANGRLRHRVEAQIHLREHLLAMRDEVARLQGISSTTPLGVAVGESLLSVVTSTARDAGIQGYATRMTAMSSDLLSLLLEDIPFTALTTWLLALEHDHGVAVERINIDASAIPGVVNAQTVLTVRRRGP